MPFEQYEKDILTMQLELKRSEKLCQEHNAKTLSLEEAYRETHDSIQKINFTVSQMSKDLNSFFSNSKKKEEEQKIEFDLIKGQNNKILGANAVYAVLIIAMFGLVITAVPKLYAEVKSSAEKVLINKLMQKVSID